MCSIIGLSKCDDFEKIKKSFEKSNSRGPDGTSYYNANSALLGFKRLAIMGLNEFGMQPFSYDDKVLVCNGEIYGFRDIKIELLKKDILLNQILIVKFFYHFLKNLVLKCFLSLMLNLL